MTGFVLQGLISVFVCLSELKLKTAAAQTASDGASAASRKPPAGRRDTLSPPAPVLVRRSDVCLSTFYRDCAENTDADCRCQPGRDSRYTDTLNEQK